MPRSRSRGTSGSAVRVVLATAHSPRLAGNLAAIADDLATRHPEIPVVTIAHRPASGARGRVGAAWQAVVAAYHLATARVFIVDDYFFPIYVIQPRAGTTIIQTWHACGAFKKVGYSVLDKSFGVDEALASRVRIHSNYDVCLVASQSAAPHYAEAFRQPLDRFVSRLGIPRTDVFFGEERLARTREAVRRRYGLTDGRRVVLYAPTFRGDSVTDARATDDLDLDAAARDARRRTTSCSSGCTRSSARGRASARELEGFAIDVSDHPDINELMLVSDVLVTDYSSAIYEFALLGRPMVFFAPDYEAYEAERGFYFDYRTGVPGPIFETSEALAAATFEPAISTSNGWTVSGETSFDVADGRSAARFTDELIVPALAGARKRAVGAAGTVLRGLGVPYRGPPSPAPEPAM